MFPVSLPIHTDTRLRVTQHRTMLKNLLLLLLSFRIQAVGAKMKLSPETLTVLRGNEARFTCSTSNTQWSVMLWSLNTTVVLTISKVHGVLEHSNNITVEKNTVSKEDSWVLVLKSTERYNQGQVSCELQGIDRKTANLFVQEKGNVKLSGDDKLAFKDQSVLFECQAEGWYPEPTLQWQVNNKKVSQGEYNISSEETKNGLFTVISNLSVAAVMSSNVDCLVFVSALTTPLSSRVHLTVVAEVKGDKGDDCTVPLAVTSSLAALMLLILLCICTVLCYRRWRQAKSKQQEPIWINQSVAGRNTVAAVTDGKVNLGYSGDGASDADFKEQIEASYSELDFVSFRQVPDVVNSRNPSLHSENQAQVCLSEENIKNIRRITTV